MNYLLSDALMMAKTGYRFAFSFYGTAVFNLKASLPAGVENLSRETSQFHGNLISYFIRLVNVSYASGVQQ